MKNVFLALCGLVCVGGCSVSTAATAISTLVGIDWTSFATAIKEIVTTVQ